MLIRTVQLNLQLLILPLQLLDLLISIIDIPFWLVMYFGSFGCIV